MFANVVHSREQCMYLQFDNSLNCCLDFEIYRNVYVVQSRIVCPGSTGMYVEDVGSAYKVQRHNCQ